MNGSGKSKGETEQDMKTESQILWTVARELIGVSHPQNPACYFETPLDWELLIKRAFRNRLSSSLISFCFKYHIQIPDHIKSVLLARRRDDLFRGDLYRREFGWIISELKRITSDVIPFKGLVVAETLYAEPRLRVFGDLDLLVRPESLAGVINKLQEMGFQSEPHLTPRQLRSEYKHFACASFKHTFRPVQIDLHTHITTPMLLSAQITEEFFKNAVETEIQGTRVQSLSPADTLLVLALHGEKHQWQRLSWIVDMALAVSATDTEQCSLARVRARRYQLEDALLLGIDLAGALRNQSTLTSNHSVSARSAHLDLRRARILREFEFPSPSTVLPLNLRGVVSLRPTKLSRTKYLLKRLFIPTLPDFKAAVIPDALFSLYYLIRLGRLLAKYFRRTVLHHVRFGLVSNVLCYLTQLHERILCRLKILSHRRQLFGSYCSRVNTTERVVALTFDDGPLPPFTEQLLNVLDNHEVKATFFVIGENVLKYPESVKQAHCAGHEIGNHSFTHPRLYFKSLRFLEHQIDATDQALRSIGIKEEIHFRAPYGYTLLGLPWLLRRKGRTHILFDFYPAPSEWSGSPPEKVAESVVARVKPGSIIVLHDGNKIAAPHVAATADLVISELKRQDYRFLTVSQLVALHSQPK